MEFVVYFEIIIIVNIYRTYMKNDISCVFEGFDNSGAIYISGIHAAENISVLKDRNISAILTVARGAKLAHSTDHIQHYLYIPADDNQSFDLSHYFPKAFEFIEKARRDTNILIHCMAGISRSATITAAYLIMKFGYEMNTVLTLLQRKRKIIDPNPGFRKQLAEISTRGRTVSKSVQANNTSSCSLRQAQQQVVNSFQKSDINVEREGSKYMASYDSNRTPMKCKNDDNGASVLEVHKRQKIQSKIDKVKRAFHHKMSLRFEQSNIQNCIQLNFQ